MTIFHIIA